MNSSELTTTWAPRLLSVLRIVTGLVFLEHGTQKLFSFPIPLPFPLSPLLEVQGWLEIAGGVLIILGLFTRPAAFILAGDMAVAYFIGHVPRGGFFPVVNNGDAAILYCFVFLYLAAAGGGVWSVDARRR